MKRKPIISLLLALGLTPLFTGCATIVRGGSEELVIKSTPSAAEIRLSTGQSGITPFVAHVPRKDEISATISKSGYKTFNTTIISSIDGTSLGIGTAANIIFLPIINDIVDYKTGANYSHKPNPLEVSLIPITSEEHYTPDVIEEKPEDIEEQEEEN